MFKPHSDIPREDLLEAATILLFFMGSKVWISAGSEGHDIKYFIQLNDDYDIWKTLIFTDNYYHIIN